MKRELTLQIDGKDVLVTVHREGDTIVVERDGERHEIVVVGDRAVAAGAGASAAGRATSVPGVASSAGPGGDGGGANAPPAPASGAGAPATSSAAAGGGDARAPMVGVVREVHVAAGDAVDEGERLITMEAMKMDIYVNAPVSGKVAAVHCKPGDTATEGAVLATVGPAAGGAGAP